jgi:hypothetical protein
MGGSLIETACPVIALVGRPLDDAEIAADPGFAAALRGCLAALVEASRSATGDQPEN